MQPARAEAAFEHDEPAVRQRAQIRDAAAGPMKAERRGLGAPRELRDGAELRVEPLQPHERAGGGAGERAVGCERFLVGDPKLLRRVAPGDGFEAEVFARLRENRRHRQPLGARLPGPETQHRGAAFRADVESLRGGDVGHALKVARVRRHRHRHADFPAHDAPGGGVDLQRERHERVRVVGHGDERIAARPHQPAQVRDLAALQRKPVLPLHPFHHHTLRRGGVDEEKTGADGDTDFGKHAAELAAHARRGQFRVFLWLVGDFFQNQPSLQTGGWRDEWRFCASAVHFRCPVLSPQCEGKNQQGDGHDPRACDADADAQPLPAGVRCQ